MNDLSSWRFDPDPTLPLTVLQSRPEGFNATVLPAPWEMPPDAVLWIQSTRASWQPGPAHAFNSDIPVRHQTQQTQDPAGGAGKTKTRRQPAGRSVKPEQLQAAEGVPVLW